MTNEEAVKMLTAKAECMMRESSGEDLDCNHRNCDECDLCYAQGTMGEQREALKVAIEALQNSPAQMTGISNLISRDEAIDAMTNTLWHYPNECYRNLNEYEFAKGLAELGLKSVPSVQPERKTGTSDLISRCELFNRLATVKDLGEAFAVIQGMPTEESQITFCKDCTKHNKRRGYFYDGTIVGIKDCCPLVEIRGKAKGHEFDYQYCVYAERRIDG